MPIDDQADLITSIKRWIAMIKKAQKMMGIYSIPKDIESLQSMKRELEEEEAVRMKTNKLREEVKALIREKKKMAYFKKIERRQKIRKFLHLKYKTFNEYGVFGENNMTEAFQDDEHLGDPEE